MERSIKVEEDLPLYVSAGDVKMESHWGSKAQRFVSGRLKGLGQALFCILS
jgi:hypothetical protein